jgi:hypothetical protein
MDERAFFFNSRNPLGKELYYQEYKTQIPSIMEKIRLLLNCHQIQLLGEHDFFYLVHMKEARDDRVHYYKFARVEHTP